MAFQTVDEELQDLNKPQSMGQFGSRPTGQFGSVDEELNSLNTGLDPSIPSITGEFGKGLSQGMKQLKGMGYGLAGLAGTAAGIEPLKKWGIEGYKRTEEEMAPYAGAVPSYKDIGGVRDAALYAAHGLGTVAPTIAASVVGGGVGGIGARALTKWAIPKALQIGGSIGAGATSLGMEAGSIAGEQARETGDIQPGKAFAYAIPAAGLDVFPQYALAKRIGLFGGPGDKARLLRRVIGGAGKQFAMEAPTEAAQQILESYGAGREPTIEEIINAGLLGGMAGGAMGAMGGVVPPRRIPMPPSEQEPITDRTRLLEYKPPMLDWWRGPGARGVRGIPMPEGPLALPPGQGFTMEEPPGRTILRPNLTPPRGYEVRFTSEGDPYGVYEPRTGPGAPTTIPQNLGAPPAETPFFAPGPGLTPKLQEWFDYLKSRKEKMQPDLVSIVTKMGGLSPNDPNIDVTLLSHKELGKKSRAGDLLSGKQAKTLDEMREDILATAKLNSNITTDELFDMIVFNAEQRKMAGEQKQRGLYKPKETIEEEVARKEEEGWNRGAWEKVKEEDPALTKEETFNTLTSTFDDEIMELRKGDLKDGRTEPEIDAEERASIQFIENEALPPSAEIEEKLFDFLTAESEPTKPEPAPELVSTVRPEVIDRIVNEVKANEEPTNRIRFTEKLSTAEQQELVKRGVVFDVDRMGKPILGYSREARIQDLREKVSGKRLVGQPSPTRKGETLLPGMKVGLEIPSKAIEGKAPTLEGTPLMKAAEKAEQERVQPELFGKKLPTKEPPASYIKIESQENGIRKRIVDAETIEGKPFHDEILEKEAYPDLWVDKSIADYIRRINDAGFETTFSESGIKSDHLSRSPDPAYLGFVPDPTKIEIVKEAAKNSGFKVDEKSMKEEYGLGTDAIIIRMPAFLSEADKINRWEKLTNELTKNVPPRETVTAPLERGMDIEKEFGLNPADAHFFNIAIEKVKKNPGKWTTLAEGIQKEAMRASVAAKGNLDKTGDLKLAKEISNRYLSEVAKPSFMQWLKESEGLEMKDVRGERGKELKAKYDAFIAGPKARFATGHPEIGQEVTGTTSEGKTIKGQVSEIDIDGTIRVGTPDGNIHEIRPENVRTEGLDRESFQRVSDTYSKENSPEKRIVDSPGEIPERILRQIPEDQRGAIKGVYDPAERKTYLVRENIGSEAELRDIIDHEDIKHYATDTFLGKEANNWFNRVYMKYGRSGLADIAKERGLDLNTQEGRIEAAREKIARMPIDTPGPIKQFWAWLREKLSKIFPDMKISDLEIQRTFKVAREAMEKGEFVARDEKIEGLRRQVSGLQKPQFATKTMTPEEKRIDDHILSKVPDARNLKEKIRDTWDNFYYSFVNKWWPVEKQNPQAAASLRLAIPKGYGVATTALEKGVPVINQTITESQTIQMMGEGFSQILSPIQQAGELRSFTRYGVSKRTIEKAGQNVETGIDLNDAKAIITLYENQKVGNFTYKQHFDRLGAYQDNILQYYRNSGMLSQETYNLIKAKNLMYFPFYRAIEQMGPDGVGQTIQSRNILKRMTGGKAPILDPIESIVKNTYSLIMNAEKNLALKNYVDLASPREILPGTPGYTMHRHSISLYEMKKSEFFQDMLEDAGLGKRDVNGNFRLNKGIKGELEDEIVNIFRPNFIKGQENVFVLYDKGKPRIFEVDKEIGRALHALDKDSVNLAFKILSAPAKLLRAGAILSPEFMARNPIRDWFSAMVFAKHGFNPWNFFEGLADVAGKKEVYYKWLMGGGSQSSFVSLDRSELRSNVNQLLSKRRLQGLLTGNDYKEIVKNLVSHPVEGLRILSELSEMGTRLGVYQKALKKGAPQQEAILESRESTIDFGRIGAKSKALNMIIAFWNANVQGIDKQIRQLDFIHPENRARALRTATRATLMITIPSLLLAYANQDDKRYQDLPEWQKDLFWIIPTEKNLWRIPKPFTLGMIFGTVPEKIMNWMRTDDPKTFENIGTALLSGSLPGIVPTAALPFIESWANKSVFTGRPIVPRGKEELKPEYQYQPYTTETAKGIAKVISSFPIIGETGVASPAKIENFVRGWTGGLGGYALKVADQALEVAGVAPEKVMPSRTLADIPVIKAFVARYPGTDSQAIQDFYEIHNKAVSTKGTITSLVREGKLDEADRLRKSSPALLMAYTSSHRIQEALANMKRFIEKIYSNPSIDPEEKRRIIDQTYLNMISIAKSFNDAFEKRGIK